MSLVTGIQSGASQFLRYSSNRANWSKNCHNSRDAWIREIRNDDQRTKGMSTLLLPFHVLRSSTEKDVLSIDLAQRENVYGVSSLSTYDVCMVKCCLLLRRLGLCRGIYQDGGQ